MKINSNTQAMIAQGVLKKNEGRFSNSTEKLSSGYMINSAKDNPAGMAITNKMNATIKSLKKANNNSSNAINAVQTAEGALSDIEAMLQRMNQLAVKGANGTMSDSDRKAIQDEVDQLANEIKRIATTTEYNTQPLLDGTQDLKGYSSNPDVRVRSYNEEFKYNDYQIEIAADGTLTSLKEKKADGSYEEVKDKYNVDPIVNEDGSTTTKITSKIGSAELIIDTKAGGSADLDIHGIGGMTIQTGTKENQDLNIVIPTVSWNTMGIANFDGTLALDYTTKEGSTKAIDQIAGAIDFISHIRSELGAYQNRLEATVSNLDNAEENLTSSYSTIKDIDMAEEMVEYTTLQVLVQAGTSMLAQANEQPQQALQLLQ